MYKLFNSFYFSNCFFLYKMCKVLKSVVSIMFMKISDHCKTQEMCEKIVLEDSNKLYFNLNQ